MWPPLGRAGRASPRSPVARPPRHPCSAPGNPQAGAEAGRGWAGLARNSQWGRGGGVCPVGGGLSQLCQGDEASVPAQPPSGLTPLSWTPASGRGFWGQRHLHTLNSRGGLVPSGLSWPRQTGASRLAVLPGGRLGPRSRGRRSVRTQTGLASTFRPSMLARACGLGEGSWGRTHAPGLRIGGASAGHPAPPLELGGGPCTAVVEGPPSPRGALARSGGSVGGSTSLPGPGEGGRFPGAGGRSQAPSSVPQPCPAGRAAGPSAPPPNAACRCPLTHSPRCARATRGPTPASVPQPAPPPPPCTLPQCCVWNRWGSRLAPLGGDHVE